MSRFLATFDRESAMSYIVGGQYETMGEGLRRIVETHGLKDGDYLIDVGCGSGRLAWALSQSKFRDTIRYLGIDIVPEMLEFAAEKCGQPAWRFELILEPKIPEVDGCADMVCFISVFTHLMQEESFLYLREAQRVLKPGGLNSGVLSRYQCAGTLENIRGERELGRGATIQTNGYFSFPGFSQGLGRKARSGDSSRRSAWSRPATLRSAQAMIFRQCGKTTVGRAPCAF